MLARRCQQWTAALVSLGLVALPMPAVAEQNLRCDSHGFKYRYCRADTDNRVELVRKHSLFDCREGRSWGYDRYGVWVDHGCSAEFRVGRDGHHDRNKAIGIGVAVLGLAALAAAANSRKQQAQQEAEGDVPAWAVGQFSGYDEQERVEVRLHILPGGGVTGSAGDHEFSGQWRNGQLDAGKQRFRVERSGSGFLATDVRDDRHRVSFRLASSGY